jgi:hypothetical protein
MHFFESYYRLKFGPCTGTDFWTSCPRKGRGLVLFPAPSYPKLSSLLTALYPTQRMNHTSYPTISSTHALFHTRIHTTKLQRSWTYMYWGMGECAMVIVWRKSGRVVGIRVIGDLPLGVLPPASSSPRQMLPGVSQLARIRGDHVVTTLR